MTLAPGSLARLALAAAWLVATPALAEPPPPPPAPVMPAAVTPLVDVEVKIIHATKGTPRVDAALQGMLEMLRTLPFDAYRLLDGHAVRLRDGSEEAVALGEGRRLRVHLLSHDAREARVRVELMSGEVQVLDTTVSIHRNRMFYLAVQRFQGGSLIIPVGVRY